MNWLALQDRTNRAALRVFGSTQQTPVKLGWQPVDGDFVEPTDQVFLEGVSATAGKPVFVMCSDDVPAVVIGETLQRGADSWQVVDQLPDGRGLTTLVLEMAQ